MSTSSPTSVSSKDRQALTDKYRLLLLEDIVPFWLRHGIDDTHGGVFTCVQGDGAWISKDKYLWSQGRAIWTFAALFNRIKPEPRFLEIASQTTDFVLHHGREKKGTVLFRISGEGPPWDQP